MLLIGRYTTDSSRPPNGGAERLTCCVIGWCQSLLSSGTISCFTFFCAAGETRLKNPLSFSLLQSRLRLRSSPVLSVGAFFWESDAKRCRLVRKSEPFW